MNNHAAVSQVEQTRQATAKHNLGDPNNVAANPQQTNGVLAPEARRVLVSLLRQGVILAAQKPKLFELVCQYQAAIENHLADMYLKLLLDPAQGIAFVQQQTDLDEVNEQDDEKEAVVSLISRRTLTLYDTLLLLVLRKHYQERESTGEQRIVIDIDRLEAYLTPFLPLTNSDRGDRLKLGGAIKRLSERRILTVVRGDDERFEITPVIRYVVNAAFLEQMLGKYQQIAAENGLAESALVEERLLEERLLEKKGILDER